MENRDGFSLWYVSLALMSACGLVYELTAASTSSFLLGDSVTQFATVTGLFMSAMGLGAWLSRYVVDPAKTYVDVQLAASLVGGLASPFLFFAFTHTAFVRPVLYFFTALTGVLVGAELPLFARVTSRRFSFRDLTSKAMSVDYIGSLMGATLFAFFTLPKLGLLRSGILCGVVGALVSLWGYKVFALHAPYLLIRMAAVLVILLSCFVGAENIQSLADQALFGAPVLYSEHTPYQRIALTRAHGSIDLFLDGNLQFSGVDEYRYHEALVHPAFASFSASDGYSNVLVLGGGDGLALREILKYEAVKSITLVDLDPAMPKLGKYFSELVDLNQHAFSSPKVSVLTEDAFAYVMNRKNAQPFDIVIVDFPDPNHYALGKLYSLSFYRFLKQQVHDGSRIVVQSTSPLAARRSYWCIVHTMEAAGFFTRPYHANVPTFGEWGYVLSATTPFSAPERMKQEDLGKQGQEGEEGQEGQERQERQDMRFRSSARLRYLTSDILRTMFIFSPDMAPLGNEINLLSDQKLVHLYEEEWAHWMR